MRIMRHNVRAPFFRHSVYFVLLLFPSLRFPHAFSTPAFSTLANSVVPTASLAVERPPPTTYLLLTTSYRVLERGCSGIKAVFLAFSKTLYALSSII